MKFRVDGGGISRFHHRVTLHWRATICAAGVEVVTDHVEPHAAVAHHDLPCLQNARRPDQAAPQRLTTGSSKRIRTRCRYLCATALKVRL